MQPSNNYYNYGTTSTQWNHGSVNKGWVRSESPPTDKLDTSDDQMWNQSELEFNDDWNREPFSGQYQNQRHYRDRRLNLGNSDETKDNDHLGDDKMEAKWNGGYDDMWSQNEKDFDADSVNYAEPFSGRYQHTGRYRDRRFGHRTSGSSATITAMSTRKSGSLMPNRLSMTLSKTA